MSSYHSGRFHDEYPVTSALLLVILGFFILEIVIQQKLSGPDQEQTIERVFSITNISLLDALGALIPVEVWKRGEIWRLVTYCFLHGGIIHLAFNTYAFIDLGRILEPLLGRERFLTSFLICGIGAGLASTAYHASVGEAGTRAIGASGALFGFMGMLIGFSVRHRDREMRNALLRSLIYAVLITALVPGIDHSAHAGGALVGFIFGLFMPRYVSSGAARRWRAPFWASVGLCTIALSFSVWGLFQLLLQSRDG